MSNKKHVKPKEQYTHDRSWFIVYTVALIFGIIWTLLGTNDLRLLFVTAAFICFLRAGIHMEMSARALHEDDSY